VGRGIEKASAFLGGGLFGGRVFSDPEHLSFLRKGTRISDGGFSGPTLKNLSEGSPSFQVGEQLSWLVGPPFLRGFLPSIRDFWRFSPVKIGLSSFKGAVPWEKLFSSKGLYWSGRLYHRSGSLVR